MANATSIEWTDFNWNFLRGCSRVSEGCRNCYAESIAARFSQPGQPYEGLAKHVNHEARWTGEISFHEDILLQPLRWKKPRKVFVNSMSDLFHEKVTDEMLDKAFAVMALTPQHTYQVLTKRPERMRDYVIGSYESKEAYTRALNVFAPWVLDTLGEAAIDKIVAARQPGFLQNVWLGVSVEDQKTADERVPLLLQTPAAVRWISAEPLLARIDFAEWLEIAHRVDTGKYEQSGWEPPISWIVAGGESGYGARPCDIGWIRSIIGQCKAAGVPVFVKQVGSKPIWSCEPECVDPAQAALAKNFGLSHDATTCACRCHERLLSKKGGDPSEWPEDLRIREYPQ